MAAQDQATLVISDFKRLIRELNKIEPELVRQMKRDLKEIAEIPRAAVRSEIPQRPPLRGRGPGYRHGMQRVLSPTGKTWNTRRNARTVTIKTKSPRRAVGFGTKGAGIVSLVISSPATIIADMAGRGNMKASIDGQKTDWYVYPNAKGTTDNTRPGYRRHTVNKQGYRMVEALDRKAGGPSRYVYPAVEDAMPRTADRVSETIAEFTRVVEREING